VQVLKTIDSFSGNASRRDCQPVIVEQNPVDVRASISAVSGGLPLLLEERNTSVGLASAVPLTDKARKVRQKRIDSSGFVSSSIACLRYDDPASCVRSAFLSSVHTNV
jgi:hypothetical protein